jgi:hypothetical protein
MTAVNRDADDARVSGALRSAGYTGGLDWSHEWARRAWRFSGFLAGSHVRGDPLAIAATQRSAQRYFQQPDADHLALNTNARSLSGFTGQVQIYKQSGLHWTGDLALYAVSPGYEVNDLGFQSRADQLGMNGRLVYQENRPGKILRNYGVASTVGYNTNFDAVPIGNSISLGAFGEFLNFHGFNVDVGGSLGTNDDRLTRGGPLGRNTTQRWFSLNYYSNYRRNTAYNASAFASRWQSGGWYVEGSAGLTLKPAPNWNIAFGPRLQRVFDPGQYLTDLADPLATTTFGRRYVFADLRQTTLALDTRLNVTFSPRLSLQMYAQPFLSGAAFGAPKEFKQPRTFTFTDYSVNGTVQERTDDYLIDPDASGPAPSFTVDKSDFNLRSLRGNAVLRWEWRPGSTVFFAWQQMRQQVGDHGDFNFNRDRRALFRAAPDNVFLVKLSYWVNP